MVRPVKFEITDRETAEGPVLAIAGELDLSTVPRLAQRVEALREEQHAALTLDLSDLTFMDSSGLRLLIELNGQSQNQAWRLTLIRSRHEAANTVLRITGAHAALPFEDPER